MKGKVRTALGALAIVGLSTVSASAATFTFSSPGYTSIPPSGSSGSTMLSMVVSGITNVTDVNLTLHDLTHTWSADLDIYLDGPSGSWRRMMTDEGGSADWTHDDLTFDDSASTGSPTPGSDQSIRPDYALSYFNGRDPNGVWRLYIRDDAYGDRGHMHGWSLTFEADAISDVPLPAGLPLLLVGLGAVGIMRSRKKA